MLKKLYNLRPYSWIDLFLVGLVARFSVIQNFMFKDLFMILGLFFLWCFFNSALEFRHGYSYRSKPSSLLLIISMLFPIIGIYYNPISFVFVLLSMLLVGLYLLKDKILGNLSFILRGLIQSSYFFYALMFYTDINFIHLIIGIVIFLIYSVRALIGDIRDVKHNREANKETFVVNYDVGLSIILIEIILILSILLIIHFFSLLAAFPLFLFCSAIIFFRNGYVLHQLMIFTTS
ncbi:MAG: hypothetical protein V3V78_01940, partial [Candidatus Woesearchaeota archaeon]